MTKDVRAQAQNAVLGDSNKMAVVADSTVVAAGGLAATSGWWGPMVASVPDVLQGLILVSTVVFVVARAANEVIKFIRTQKGRGDPDDRA